MDFKAFVRKEVVMGYFAATTCIAVAMAIIGTMFEPEARFGYGILFSPLIYGALAIPVILVGYSKRELTMFETLIRNIIQLLMIEFIVLLINYVNGALRSASITVAVALSVLAIYVAVNIVLWTNDAYTAKEINKALKEMQNRHDGNK